MADEWEDHFGINERRGQGVGCGAFDAVAECRRASKYGRNYSDRKQWDDEIEEKWEKELEQAREEAASEGETLRLRRRRYPLSTVRSTQSLAPSHHPNQKRRGEEIFTIDH